ncbi:MAG: hypothetical protein QM767_26050 [Anaeromyxobacter sp.]
MDTTGLSASDLDAARALRMNLSHASVGGNIWDGLNTLGSDTKFEFPNWSDNNRGNPGWEAKVSQFESWVASHTSDFDVFQNKFCYIDQDADFASYRDSMVALAKQYPTKVFVWWTMPIQTDDANNAKRAAFNKQVRDYCKANDLPLYDIADIESHESDGSAVVSGGVEALDPTQSSDGGHLNAAGAARAAKAQWALMAQLADRSPLPGTGGASSTGGSSSVGGNVSASSSSGGKSAASGGTSNVGGESGANEGGASGEDSTDVTDVKDDSGDGSGCVIARTADRSGAFGWIGLALGLLGWSRRRRAA